MEHVSWLTIPGGLIGVSIGAAHDETTNYYYKILISVLSEVKPKIGPALVWALSTVMSERRAFCDPNLPTAAHRADKVSCWLIRRGTPPGCGY